MYYSVFVFRQRCVPISHGKIVEINCGFTHFIHRTTIVYNRWYTYHSSPFIPSSSSVQLYIYIIITYKTIGGGNGSRVQICKNDIIIYTAVEALINYGNSE
jgi:hypothetical protein